MPKIKLKFDKNDMILIKEAAKRVGVSPKKFVLWAAVADAVDTVIGKAAKGD